MSSLDTRDPLLKATDKAAWRREIERAVAAERERCAKLAEDYRTRLTNGGAINACKAIAAAIRAPH